MHTFLKTKGKHEFNNFLPSFEEAAQTILSLQKSKKDEVKAHLNTVITDGKQIMATRFTTDEQLSLFYTIGHHINKRSTGTVMEFDAKNPSAVLIASEPLGDYAKDWREVPVNHALLVNSKLEVNLHKINT